jgi:hypothetical protein
MNRILLYAIVLTGIISGCAKEDTTIPIEAKTFDVDATASTKWKYFSFEKNDTVTVSDPATSSEWDLAFQRYRIRTNGGKSGNGMGSAANSYKTGQSGFDELTTVPDTATFSLDSDIQIAVQGGYATYIVNPEVYTWFAIELAAQGTQIVPTDFVYIIKTGTGKYAKVWFKSYYSATNVSGHITFQYKYQSDGSKKLE